jgi:PAS domain S-box-containing protein
MEDRTVRYVDEAEPSRREPLDAKRVEARYRDLLESMPDGIVMVDGGGQIVFANGHAEQIFGYGSGELAERPVELLLPDRFHAAHFGHRARYFGQPRPRAMGAGLDLYGRRKDGTEIPVEISLSPLRLENTTVVMSAIRDVSDRRRIEQELREKNVALAEASRAKDRFLASMSHELRTPLNAIIGFTGTLLMRLPGPLTPDQEKQLRTVQASARHLLSLISDLLDIAKISAGRLELLAEIVDCGRVVEDVVATLRPEADRKSLALTVAADGDLPPVRADPRALSQIVINLAQNAIKFTDRGHVRIGVRRCDVLSRDGIAIDVEDSGPGIRPEDRALLFEAFSRVPRNDRRHHEGTGLGLHLSRQLAELMGGRITLRSELGRGSVFTLELPGESSASG